MDLARSPLAPATIAKLPPIDGLKMWTASTGGKYGDRHNVWVARLAAGTSIAGVFTRSRAPGAPVIWSKERLAEFKPGGGAGIIVNAGNANVFTGKRGAEGVREMAACAAEFVGLKAEDIFVASTGVIGEPLGMGPIADALMSLDRSSESADFLAAATAIGTTDTFEKLAHARCKIAGQTVNICGIVKGSGMIAPDMATMLGFIFTDANIAQPLLQTMLGELSETSFNAITVDSDTSTSDTVLLAATGAAGHPPITGAEDEGFSQFRAALKTVMMDLAHQVVRDGEGARKFIQIKVDGANTAASAKKIAMSIANSPLVKTAIAGEDANWGRIVMAVGKAGEPADRDALSIKFGPHLVAYNGLRADGYDEAAVSEYMRNAELSLEIDVGVGSASFTVWTCDLTHSYIDINADYRS